MAKRILIKQPIFVDDDPTFIKTVKEWQKEYGLKEYATTDIEESLEWARKGVTDRFICDLKMPGEDGISVIQKVRTIDPNIKLVILTGYDLTDEQKKIVTTLGGKVCLKWNLEDLLNSLVRSTGKEKSLIAIQLQEKLSKLERLNREIMNIKSGAPEPYPYMDADDLEMVFIRGRDENLNTQGQGLDLSQISKPPEITKDFPSHQKDAKELWYKKAHPIIAIIVGLIAIFTFFTGIKSCRDLADKKHSLPPTSRPDTPPSPSIGALPAAPSDDNDINH